MGLWGGRYSGRLASRLARGPRLASQLDLARVTGRAERLKGAFHIYFQRLVRCIRHSIAMRIEGPAEGVTGRHAGYCGSGRRRRRIGRDRRSQHRAEEQEGETNGHSNPSRKRLLNRAGT